MNQTTFAGIDDVLAAIDGLGALASHEVQVKALKAAGGPIADDVTRRLQEHRFSGELAGDIAIAESTEAAGQGEAVVLIGAKSEAYKLRFLEFGTEKQRATPVIRPAWDSAAPSFGARCLAEYQRAYRGIIDRVSRKKAA